MADARAPSIAAAGLGARPVLEMVYTLFTVRRVVAIEAARVADVAEALFRLGLFPRKGDGDFFPDLFGILR
jgi:hypothetical protein